MADKDQMAICALSADRAAMHRRAQRAEGELARLAVKHQTFRRRWTYWLGRYQELRRATPLRPDDLRVDYWLIPKPRWLRQGQKG